MDKNTLVKLAVKEALNGGRKFGSAEHRSAFQYLATSMAEACTIADKGDRTRAVDMHVDAMVAIANQSALQQQLFKAGVIDLSLIHI